MFRIHLVLFSLVSFVLIVIQSASSDEADAAAATAVAVAGNHNNEQIPSDPIIDRYTVAVAEYLLTPVPGCQDYKRTPTDPIIDKFAKPISEGLLNSPVLGIYAHFQVDCRQVHDLFFRVGSAFLKAADICDLGLADIAAQAGQEVGMVDSRLYFYTTGYLLAKFFQTTGILTKDSADYLAKEIVSAIELVACSNGLYDTETTMNAVVYGVFNVLETYGLVTYDNVKELFCLFAEEIKTLAGIY